MDQHIRTGLGYIYSDTQKKVIPHYDRIILPHWQSHSEIPVGEASLLYLGWDPDEIRALGHVPHDYKNVCSLFLSALKSGEIEGTLVKSESDKALIQKASEVPGSLVDLYDCTASTVRSASVRRWQNERDNTDHFFRRGLSGELAILELLNEQNPHYSWKLAGAIRARLSVAPDDKGLGTYKTRVEKWLRENWRQYYPKHLEGQPSDRAYAEMARIANWDDRSGAPEKQ